jgi:uncharacterized protein
MKESKYNFFYPYEANDAKMIAYNSFSNALALMDKDKYDKFINFRDNGATIEDDELIKQLRVGRFIIDDDCNEIEMLRLRLLEGRYNSSHIGLTIAPTTPLTPNNLISPNPYGII